MKKSARTVRLILICAASFALFVTAGYLYISGQTEPAEQNISDVPYTFPEPENAGIMFDICGELTFVYLDFEDAAVKIIIPPSSDYQDEIYGYSIDYSVKADYSLVSAAIDCAGGIELESGDGEIRRYTGVQVSDMLSRTAEAEELRRNIIKALLAKISDNGIDSEIYLYIVSDTETDITVPDCYYWEKYAADMCENGVIIN